VVDELVDRLVSAQSRNELNDVARALDRVLLFGFYVIPNWHIPADRVLYWDKFGRPDKMVKSGVLTSRWWFDDKRAARLKQAVASDQALMESSQQDAGGPDYLRWLLLIALILLGVRMMRQYLRGQN